MVFRKTHIFCQYLNTNATLSLALLLQFLENDQFIQSTFFLLRIFKSIIKITIKTNKFLKVKCAIKGLYWKYIQTRYQDRPNMYLVILSSFIHLLESRNKKNHAATFSCQNTPLKYQAKKKLQKKRNWQVFLLSTKCSHPSQLQNYRKCRQNGINTNSGQFQRKTTRQAKVPPTNNSASSDGLSSALQRS